MASRTRWIVHNGCVCQTKLHRGFSMAGIIGQSVSPLGTVGEAKRARTEEKGAEERVKGMIR